MGLQFSWENASLAPKRSQVRILSAPQTCYILLQLKPWEYQGFVVYYSMIRNDNKGEKDMSLVAEIVVEQGNTNLEVDGWKVCSFWDTDSDGMEFMNQRLVQLYSPIKI